MKTKINALLNKCKVNSILLVNFYAIEENFYYFSRLPFGFFEENALILKRNSKPILLTNDLDYWQLKKMKHLKVIEIKDKKERLKVLKKELKGKRIGVNLELIPVNYKKKLAKLLKRKKLIDVSACLTELKAIKSKEEITKIKKAVAIAEKCLKRIPLILKKNATNGSINLSEKKLAEIIERTAIQLGAQGIVFKTIVASGKNGRTPHYMTSNKKISKGFLLVDFGVRYKNYCSDITRTFYVGKANKKEKMLYEIVFKAKEKAEKMIKAGLKCSTVFSEVEKFLKEKNFELIHGLGHGLGLKVHEEPNLSRNSKSILREGNTLTIEPAIYGSFGGIRIEDDILIKKNEIKKLSNAPKKLIEIRI